MASTASSLKNSFVQKLVTTIILAGVFFTSAGMVIYLSLKGKEIAVPNLIGKSEQEAGRMLEGEGLRLKVRNRTTTETVQANLISDQVPNSGTTVKAGQVVNVTISTGIEAKEAKATPKPTATPRPKPKPSPSPKGETDKNKAAADKKPEGEKGSPNKSTSGKESNKGETGKAKTTSSPKPTPKPSPKKADIN